MTPIKLKICGMSDAENIRAVMSLKPDLMGFIFYKGSPRYVGEGFTIPPDFSHDVMRVGVFVNSTADEMQEKIDALALHAVQLHGDEPVETARRLKERGQVVIKVFSVSDEFDFQRTKPFQEYSDYFLFDTKGKNYGGNAVAFNWQILEEYDQKIPFILSGGLSIDNLSDLTQLKGMNLFGVDLNSGVETRPALKDINKIKSVQKLLKKLTA